MTRFLTLLLLASPAMAAEPQLPSCMPVKEQQLQVQCKSEVAILVKPIYLPVNIFKAKYDALRSKPCTKTGLIRSKYDGFCYRPSRLPRRASQ